MRKAERFINLGWTPEGMRAYETYLEVTNPSWRRALAAENTRAAPQAHFEEDAIHEKAMKQYLDRMQRIGKKYPGVPMPP